jgi:hypothetical protein
MKFEWDKNKAETNQKKPKTDEMPPKYDFSKGVRGKHFKVYLLFKSP